MSPDPKADWLNAVAHALKTPINSVSGCLDLIQQLGPLNERQQQFADRAMSGLRRMEHLVARLTDISWIDADMPLRVSTCDLSVLINEAVDLLKEAADQRSITVHVDVDGRTAQVEGDAQLLGQVIDNLVGNAIKYNRQGGTVWVTATHEGDAVLVAVRDTGLGILPEDQPRVFDRFYRSRDDAKRRIEGSGLGLAITQAIIHKHRGRIWLESQPGEGSVFWFTIPLRVTVSEGDDQPFETFPQVGESADQRDSRPTERGSEERDVVNDALQENREITQVDSTGDEV